MRAPSPLLAVCCLTGLGCASLPARDAGQTDAAVESDGGSDSGVDSGWAPFGVEQWCAVQSLAQCRRDERCGLLDPAQESECRGRAALACDQAAYEEGVDAGRLGYSPAHAAACANAYASGPCSGAPAECASVFQGQVPADGGCLLVEECEPGSYCLVYSQTCPHTCYPFRPLGAPCNYWDEQCDSSAQCALDAGTLHCAALLDAGQACANPSDCLSNLVCVQGKCVPERATYGEACGQTQGYPFCDVGLFCRTQSGGAGLCERAVGLGGTCAGGDCATGLRCSSFIETGTCIPLGSEGAVCDGYGDCKNELFCQTSRSRCAQLPVDGGNCSVAGFECGLTYYCDFTTSTCQGEQALGGQCSYDAMCRSGSCQYGLLGDGGYGSRCVLPCSQRDGGR